MFGLAVGKPFVPLLSLCLCGKSLRISAVKSILLSASVCQYRSNFGGEKMTLSVLQKIEHLDARKDHQEIIRLTTAYEYPFLMQKALEFALFRTYAVPSIGALLDQTNHFHREGQKRYDDTALLIAEWVENGYDSENG